jgi:hypothetical protein
VRGTKGVGMNKDKDKIMKYLYTLLPKKQVKEVLENSGGDIDYSFLGFVDIYYYLSKIIPTHFTVVDLGCGYNPQCFFFLEHKKYVAVDSFPNTVRFQSNNCTFYEMDIKQFILENIKDFDLDETFAICSYVPNWNNKNRQLAREYFKNVFTYYPSHKSFSPFHNIGENK